MFKKKKITIMMLIAMLVVAFTACSTDTTQPQDQGDVAPNETKELVVYSTRNETFVQPLLDKFESETGIKVLALHGGDAVINKIKEEGRNVQADIVISNDIGALEHLRLEGFLQGYEPNGIEAIEERYIAEDMSWFALSARARVFMYNKDLITEEEMPKSILDLADEKWKGEFAITRGGNGSMIAHISALRNEWGDDKTLEWLDGVKENAGAITQGHGDVRRAVGAGEFKFGLVNNYYYHQQLREPNDNNVGVIYLDQAENEMGTVVNAAGVGFVKGAPNELNGQRFLDWILQPENQREFSYASLEVPINPAIEAVGEAAKISDFKVQSMPLRELGKVWADTRNLIERSGLDLEIR
ncbi:extracellular solute-binding protein [Alkaliphilus transvaalensis]|uniref:extracellular solute-binding protein n=1 Tax=Alkaliphilus transvaalensis TaxID=114628 RepID=UPI000478CEC2|nr:extracellular solute-binding protein [Alkaliphilus transvaalensis]